MPRAQYPMPADFPKLALTMTSAELAVHYKSGASCAARWRRESRVPPPVTGRRSAGTFKPLPRPDNFADLAPSMTRRAAAAFFGHHVDVIDRWASEAGITFRPQISVVSGQRLRISERSRDMTRAGQAAEFLRHFSPVYRCDEAGCAKPKGEFWRRGNAVLTDAEIIERAEFKGFDPDAWKRIPTTHTEGVRA